MDRDGSEVPIAGIEARQGLETVYNIEVEGLSTYYASGSEVLSHNCNLPRTGSYGDLRRAGAKDGHHVIQDAAVRDLPGYSRTGAPAVELAGPSTRVGSPHYNATQAQRRAGGGNYAAERRIGYRALREAGLSPQQSRTVIDQADQYFRGIGVGPNTPTRIPGNRRRP